MHNSPPLKSFCEFFAGIGLVGEALGHNGWRCTYANDIDAKKRGMYEGHYGPSAHYHEGDVWAVDDVLDRIAGRPMLATASFPCTDMSLAGKRRGLAGEQSGALFGFLQVMESLAERRPPMVMLENVPGFLTSHDGEDFETAVAELAGLGYWLDSFILDSRWFVPQSRPRLFLLGYGEALVDSPLVVKQDDAAALSDPWGRAVERADRLRPQRLRAVLDAVAPSTGWVTVDCGNPRQQRYALRDFIDLDDNQPWWSDAEVERHAAMMFDRHRRQIDVLRLRIAATEVFTAFRRIRAGQQRMEVRFDGVAGCLRTPRGGSAKQIVLAIDHDRLRMRWMTPREYARLQGSGDFTLPDNAIQGYFGFGDAVCVPVIEWIDRHMLTPVIEAASHARPVLTS